MSYLIESLSLFLPCYNEEANLESTVNKTIPILTKIAKDWELIIVNDGSKDKTGDIALKLQKTYPQNIKIVTHLQNRGYGASFKSGFYSARYDWISFIDADGQFDFNDIKKLLAVQKKTEADLVIGYYLGRKVSPVRIWGTKLWQLAVFLLFGLKVRDIDCGFKLVKKIVIDTIPRLEAERGPFISSEFLIKAKKAGFKIVEVGVSHYPRTGGQATGTKLSVVLSGLRDLIRLWVKFNFQL
jgi:glycosyltransferase involved in cell wall biosynthesis